MVEGFFITTRRKYQWKHPHELKKWGNPAVLSDYKPELITRNNVKYDNVQLLLKPAIL